MKLEKLNDSQIELMETIKQKWLDRILKPSPFDEQKCRNGIEWMYKLAGLKKPIVIVVDSPMAAQYAVPYAKAYLTILYSMLKTDPKEFDQVGDQVGAQVWAQVWDQVGDQVGAQVGDQVRAQVRAQVGAQVWAQVGDQVWAQVRAQVRAQVGDQVGDQVGAQVWAQVGDQVEKNSKLKFEPFGSYGNIRDYGWVAFYDFFQQIGIFKHERFNNFADFLNSGIYESIQLDGLCVVCQLPKKVKRKNSRIHSENASAIEWNDGYKLYFWNGCVVPEKLILTPESITKEDILKETNAEVRRCFMEKLGAKVYYNVLSGGEGVVLIDEDTDNQGFPMRLYKTKMKDGIINEYVQFIEVICPSTERVYNIYPPNQNSKNVWEAKASTFGMKEKEFKPLIES